MKFKLFLFLVLFFWLGCASQPVVLLNGYTGSGNLVCLDDQANIPEFVQKFYETRDLTTEEGKIDYLIERVKRSKMTFIRNRVEYTGPQSASFLRWKLGRMEKRHRVKVETARDFVAEVASGSRVSGEPYVVVLPDGTHHNFQSLLENELVQLETCLRQISEKKVESLTSSTPTNATSPP